MSSVPGEMREKAGQRYHLLWHPGARLGDVAFHQRADSTARTNSGGVRLRATHEDRMSGRRAQS